MSGNKSKTKITPTSGRKRSWPFYRGGGGDYFVSEKRTTVAKRQTSDREKINGFFLPQYCTLDLHVISIVIAFVTDVWYCLLCHPPTRESSRVFEHGTTTLHPFYVDKIKKKEKYYIDEIINFTQCYRQRYCSFRTTKHTHEHKTPLNRIISSRLVW